MKNGKICDYAQLVDEEAGLYLCNKYKSYCYFDEPNKRRCIDTYGSEYDGTDDIKDDEEGNEETL